MSWLLVVASLWAAPASDPRPQVARLLLDGQVEAALAETERVLAVTPELGGKLGFTYLRGRLLDQLGRSQEATDAFLESVSVSPRFNHHSFLRLALDYERLGHPEMAAGLAAKVVAARQPADRVGEAASLLRRVLAEGGDCRVLTTIRESTLGDLPRRQIQLARAECAVSKGELATASRLVASLLRERRGDEPGRAAAELAVSALGLGEGEADRGAVDPNLALLVGLTFHDHREFSTSSRILDLTLAGMGSERLSRAQFENRYARVRNDFWEARYAEAAVGFARLAVAATDPQQRAKALFQQARCQESVGAWVEAAQSYRQAFLTQPTGDWASAGLLAAMRLEWRSGKDESALELYELLRSGATWRGHTARGALFLAASDLVRGRADRAGPWLDQARRSGAPVVEVAYWRGRLAEAQLAAGELTVTPAVAVAAYLTALRNAPYHPLAQAARARLQGDRLFELARSEGLRLAGSSRPNDLYAAWLLLGGEEPEGRRALQTMAAKLSREPASGAFLRMGPAPIERWALWRTGDGRTGDGRTSAEDSASTEQALLALGLWDEGASVISRFFPVSDPDLAFTGSLLLGRYGQTRRSVAIAEVLAKRMPPSVPDVLLPAQYRRLLYPLVHQELLVRASADGDIDPLLLIAIIREESRFDETALSNASARGLTQFTLQTARRYAERIGVREFEATDLYRPEVSIPLGAAYVSDLRRQFGAADHAVVASYNAGEDQARVWMGHCFSRELAEYYTKVGFDQTRNYLRKVFTSWAQYREIYGDLTGADGQIQLPTTRRGG